MRTQRETSETDRNKWKVECEASETISRRATLDLEIAVRRQTDLETDYNRSTINNKELTEQVATHRHESRSKDQQIDTLNRNVRELTLDMERLVNQNRLSSVDSTTKIDEYKSISNQATLALNACDQSLHNKMTEIETLKIEITLKETNITRIEDDMNQLNTESQVLHGKIENSLIREENIRKCNEALNVSFSNSKVNVAKLEERCRTYDARYVLSFIFIFIFFFFYHFLKTNISAIKNCSLYTEWMPKKKDLKNQWIEKSIQDYK